MTAIKSPAIDMDSCSASVFIADSPALDGVFRA
jgi:hypothetical protein